MTLPKHPKPTTPVTSRTMDAFEMLKTLIAHHQWLKEVWETISPEIPVEDRDRWYDLYYSDRQKTVRRIEKLMKEIIIAPEFETHRDKHLIIC